MINTSSDLPRRGRDEPEQELPPRHPEVFLSNPNNNSNNSKKKIAPKILLRQRSSLLPPRCLREAAAGHKGQTCLGREEIEGLTGASDLPRAAKVKEVAQPRAEQRATHEPTTQKERKWAALDTHDVPRVSTDRSDTIRLSPAISIAQTRVFHDASEDAIPATLPP